MMKVGLGIFDFCTRSRRLISKDSISSQISVAVAHMWNALFSAGTANAERQDIIFPCEFTMSSQYQNVEETVIYVVALFSFIPFSFL